MSLEEAFAELRPAMFALAYRITGNRADAEEIVQDAFVRLHGAEPKDAVRSMKAYLAAITARLSLNRLRDQRARRESYVGEWLPEPLVTEDEPAIRAEDVSFAMLVVLERLSPLERVVFVLHNAFDLTFEEIAPVVQRDAATCRKIFSRARAHMREQRPRFAIDRERHRALLRSFADAARSGNTAGLVALLDENVVLHGDGGGKALALKKPVVGNVAVAQFLAAVTRTLPADATAELIELNGEPGLVLKAGDNPVVAILVDSDGERIYSVYGISNPDKLGGIAGASGSVLA
ncbi:MAG TPA: RNA polymerase sigma factor SigJ [Bradyrhizobium sp.]|nr:RNA polymerase sigma factor SigJ [Bradyrhizobium sp.]